MIYRIWDTETNEYVDDIFIDGNGTFCYIEDDYIELVEDQNRYKIECGFKIGKKCFYENDIIEYRYYVFAPRYLKLKFDVSIGFCLCVHFNRYINIAENIDNARFSFKVIGNVNQNPELLEAK